MAEHHPTGDSSKLKKLRVKALKGGPGPSKDKAQIEVLERGKTKWGGGYGVGECEITSLRNGRKGQADRGDRSRGRSYIRGGESG